MLRVSRVKLKSAHEVEAVSKDLATCGRGDLDRDVVVVTGGLGKPWLGLGPALHKRSVRIERDELEEGALGLVAFHLVSVLREGVA